MPDVFKYKFNYYGLCNLKLFTSLCFSLSIFQIISKMNRLQYTQIHKRIREKILHVYMTFLMQIFMPQQLRKCDGVQINNKYHI